MCTSLASRDSSFSCHPITATATRFLSEILKAVAVARNAEGLARCKSHCCGMEPPTGQIDSSPTSRTSITADDDDDDLFVPIPPRPECPICMVTQPLENVRSISYSCCGNQICKACYIERKRVIEETNAERIAEDPCNPCLLESRCPFCRALCFVSDEEIVARLQRGMERSQAYAFFLMAQSYHYGLDGLRQDHHRAFQLYHRAGELGCLDGYSVIGTSYICGHMEGVDKDEGRGWHYFVLAAKRGNVWARYALGLIEYNDRGRRRRAYAHWRISAAVGCDKSMKHIRRGFGDGLVPKHEYDRVELEYCKAKAEMEASAWR